MKLWLDDLRREPEGWTRAKSVDEAIALMGSGTVEFASLDHDLGIWASEGGNGVKLTDWMAEHDCWPTAGLRVHSSNPIGVQQMLQTVDRYASYTTRGFKSRGAAPSGGLPPSDTDV